MSDGLEFHAGGCASQAISLCEIAASVDDIKDFEVIVHHDPSSIVLAATVHIVSFLVNVSTGETKIQDYSILHDCGRMVNPMMVDGQIMGGTVQGIGEVLMEAVRYDEQAQPLTISLMEYEVPRSSDIVPFHIEAMHSADGAKVFKGVGESGTIGAVPAVTSAVADALSGFPVSVNWLPLTSSSLRIALMKASR